MLTHLAVICYPNLICLLVAMVPSIYCITTLRVQWDVPLLKGETMLTEPSEALKKRYDVFSLIQQYSPCFKILSKAILWSKRINKQP